HSRQNQNRIRGKNWSRHFGKLFSKLRVLSGKLNSHFFYVCETKPLRFAIVVSHRLSRPHLSKYKASSLSGKAPSGLNSKPNIFVWFRYQPIRVYREP